MWAKDHVEYALEIVGRIKRDFHGAALRPTEPDVDVRLQTPPQFVLHALENGRSSRGRRGLGRRALVRWRLVRVADALLHLANAELQRNSFVGERQRAPRIFQRYQRARVTRRQLPLLDD